MGIKRIIKKAGTALRINRGDRLPTGHYRLHGTAEVKNSTIGNYTYISTGTLIQSADIGKFCSIGPYTVIGYGNHPLDFISTSPMFYHTGVIFERTFAVNEAFETYERVMIGNDVWIGSTVYIRNGISIGDGSVIAAGAVVTKDVPPYAIVGGVPAKLIKYRFPEAVITKLLNIKWWNWSNEELQEKQKHFITNDIIAIENFINECNAL
ncbi:MAG: CatB-related O-acetyltransferase [Ginsengibacter sp.]